jgi:DeoR/GlpR family transcriptional regulator of sugar metabolism
MIRNSRPIRSSARVRDDIGALAKPDLNGLLAEPRRCKILDWRQEEGSARVRDLSAAFAVSEATIRQDLEKMEVDGHISLQHGGAFLRTVPRQVETNVAPAHGEHR